MDMKYYTPFSVRIASSSLTISYFNFPIISPKEGKPSKTAVFVDDKNTVDSVYEETGKPIFVGRKLGAALVVKVEQVLVHLLEDEVHTLFPDNLLVDEQQHDVN